MCLWILECWGAMNKVLAGAESIWGESLWDGTEIVNSGLRDFQLPFSVICALLANERKVLSKVLLCVH